MHKNKDWIRIGGKVKTKKDLWDIDLEGKSYLHAKQGDIGIVIAIDPSMNYQATCKWPVGAYGVYPEDVEVIQYGKE